MAGIHIFCNEDPYNGMPGPQFVLIRRGPDTSVLGVAFVGCGRSRYVIVSPSELGNYKIADAANGAFLIRPAVPAKFPPARATSKIPSVEGDFPALRP